MLFSRVFAATQPRIVLTSLATACTPPRGSHSHRNFSRINTYKSLSKQTTLTVIESHSYKKHGGRGVLWLTRNPKRDFYPERPSGAEGPLPTSSCLPAAAGHSLCSHLSLFAQDSPQISSFVFKSFHTLSFSVSCKSFACHSYENCRVWVYTNNSHSGTQRSFTTSKAGAAMIFHESPITNHKSRACPPISERSTIVSLHIQEESRHGHR